MHATVDPLWGPLSSLGRWRALYVLYGCFCALGIQHQLYGCFSMNSGSIVWGSCNEHPIVLGVYLKAHVSLDTPILILQRTHQSPTAAWRSESGICPFFRATGRRSCDHLNVVVRIQHQGAMTCGGELRSQVPNIEELWLQMPYP